jgi:altered-inheritance-of-mitochondria protein 5
VTLTLSLTYLALLTHTRNRQAQSAVLRSQASTLDNLVPPDPSLPLSARRRNATILLPDGTYRPRESLEQYQREAAAAAGPGASFIETAKTKWNSEILSAVRWTQSKDWGRVREEAEDGVARLLGVQLSKEPVPVPREEEEVYPPPPPPPRTHSRVSDALHRTRDTTLDVAHAMRDEAKEVVLEAREVVAGAVEEAKGAVSKGMEKAHDLVERTKAAAHLAEERAEAKADAKLLHMSDIEKALAERYDSARREERMKRSVEEVLRERYIPMESRDNSQLRGI